MLFPTSRRPRRAGVPPVVTRGAAGTATTDSDQTSLLLKTQSMSPTGGGSIQSFLGTGYVMLSPVASPRGDVGPAYSLEGSTQQQGGDGGATAEGSAVDVTSALLETSRTSITDGVRPQDAGDPMIRLIMDRPMSRDASLPARGHPCDGSPVHVLVIDFENSTPSLGGGGHVAVLRKRATSGASHGTGTPVEPQSRPASASRPAMASVLPFAPESLAESVTALDAIVSKMREARSAASGSTPKVVNAGYVGDQGGALPAGDEFNTATVLIGMHRMSKQPPVRAQRSRDEALTESKREPWRRTLGAADFQIARSEALRAESMPLKGGLTDEVLLDRERAALEEQQAAAATRRLQMHHKPQRIPG